LPVSDRRRTRTLSEGVRRPVAGDRKEQRHHNRSSADRGQQQRHQQRKVPRVCGRHQPGAEAPGQDRLLENGTGRGRGRAAPVRCPVHHVGRAPHPVAGTSALLSRLPEGCLSPSFSRGELLLNISRNIIYYYYAKVTLIPSSTIMFTLRYRSAVLKLLFRVPPFSLSRTTSGTNTAV